jgi:hypothetical protein
MDNLAEFKKYFNRDFWRAFKDKSIFIDIPATQEEKEIFIENLHSEILEKKYYPSVPHCYIDRDKGNGVTRIIPVFCVKDYCVYYYCIKKIEPRIAYNRVPNTFGGWTLGGLLRQSEEDEMSKRKRDFEDTEDFINELHGISVSEYSFNPTAWSKAYGDLNAKLYATSQETKYKHIAELDIANFYDNIRLDILEYRIREVTDNQNAEVLSLLFHFLNYWNRKANLYNKQSVGLPQDALGDCSRILANFYLQNYDQYVYELCKKNESVYLRYADDQYIFSETSKKLEYIIFKVSKKLNTLGLAMNQAKVKISKTEELILFRSFDVFDILSDTVDKTDEIKVEEFADRFLRLLDRDGLKNIKSQGRPLLNRLLFCPVLKDIDLTKFTKILGCFLDEDYLKDIQTAHLDKIYKLLSIEERKKLELKLIKLSNSLIHNAYHYQVLDFFNKNSLDSIEIRKRLFILESI